MKKHARLMFGITRKTRFTVAMVIVAAVLVLAVVALGYIGIFGLRSELPEVAITTERAGDTFGGLGINCDVIPNINMVRDASFESSADYASMLVAGASDGSIFLTPDAVAASGYDTSVCSGDSARIISIDSEGVMSEKFNGTITGFKPARFGVATLIKDEKGFWGEDRIKEISFYGNTAIALTGNGRLISDITNSQLAGIVDTDERFSFIDTNDSGIIAAAVNGSVYISQDGKNLVPVYVPEDSGEEKNICGVGNSGMTFAVCYTDGTVVTIINGKVALSRLPVSDITSFVSDGERFIATDIKGNIYSSSNGMVYELIGETEWLKGTEGVTACAAEGRFCFILDGRKAVIISYVDSDFVIEKNEIAQSTGSDITTACLTDSGLVISGTSDKKAFATNLLTGKTAQLTSENAVIEKIIGVSGDKIYYDSGKDIYKAQILSELSVEGNLEGVDIIADDILITGHVNSAAGGAISASDSRGSSWEITGSSAWAVYGNGTNVIATDRAYSGSHGVKISGGTNGVHAMTQDLPGNAEDNFIPGTFYRLSLYAMSDNAPDKVYCWIEGDGFGRYGLELTQLGSNYKYYSYVFAVTDQMMDCENIRFNIAFEGSGSVLADDIYLGPDSYSSAGIPKFYSDTLASGSPSAIRLNNLNIGSSGYAESAMYLLSINSVSGYPDGDAAGADSGADENVFDGKSATTSLEDSLKLVKQCNSAPWFVIGSCVNQTEVDRFLEYLCGSVTSAYGGRRINNGTALPWSRQFNRFYIEINDSGKVFSSDIQKASYVNFVISMFSQSEYFSDIKDKTIFLDGMKYDGGTMISDADNHTMSVKLVANDLTATYIDNINTSYVLSRYDSPHIVTGNNGGEYINTLETSGSNCGRIISAIMTKEADFAEMLLFDADVNFAPSTYTGNDMFAGKDEFIKKMIISGLMSDITGYDELFIDLKEPLDVTSTQSVELFMSNVTSACFSKDDHTYIVIANSSNSQQSFLINDNKLGRTDSVIRRYDENGRMINERKSRFGQVRHILQPGEFIIVESVKKG